MNRGRNANTALRAFIQAHWRHKTDAQIAREQEQDTSVQKVKAIRRTLGLRRTTEHLARMHEFMRENQTDIGRGIDKQKRADKHYKLHQEQEAWQGKHLVLQEHRKYVWHILRYQAEQSDDTMAQHFYTTARSIQFMRKKYGIKRYHVLPT